jgi:hypothetical protein
LSTIDKAHCTADLVSYRPAFVRTILSAEFTPLEAAVRHSDSAALGTADAAAI